MPARAVNDHTPGRTACGGARGSWGDFLPHRRLHQWLELLASLRGARETEN